MNHIQKIKTNIKKYIASSDKYKTLNQNNIDIELTKIGGYSNMNYMGIIKDISTNDIIEYIFYREFCSKFGPLSASVDHEQESKITKFLSQKDYGPKLLYEIKDNFTISEFLINTRTLPLEKYFDKNIVEQLCSILNYFISFSYIYKYKITDNGIILNQLKEKDNNFENKIELTKNQYEKSLGDIYEKTKSIFRNFIDKFKQKYSKEKNPKEWADVELVKYYVDNFKKIYNDNFPDKGFFVINHNDVFSSNILFRDKDEKIFLIDHEYFLLNLPGNDIAYYLTEYYIKYEPKYICELDKIDYDKIFDVYENFIHKFIQFNHKYIEKDEYGKEFIEIILTKEYFIRLMNNINLYLFNWSIGNIDFDNWEKDARKEFFFVHGVDRIKFYLLGMKTIQHLKK